jgi:hypothetical protein
MKLSLSRLVCVCTLLAACEKQEPEPATQVLVTVDSDLVVGTELTRVQIEVRTTEGERQTPRHTFELARGKPKEGEVELPFSFGVSKAGQAAFQLRVTGLKDDQTIVDLHWNVRFQDQRTLRFRAFLAAVCAGNLCKAGQTCYPRRKGKIEAGSCAAIPDASTAPVTPGDEFRDAGVQAEEPEAGSGGASGRGSAGASAGRGGAGTGGAGGAGRGGTGAAAGSAAGAPAGAGCQACRPGETCVAGACQCATTVTEYYADLDGDGHGDPTRKQTACGAAPVGFVAPSDDCCDSDNGAFPGQIRGDGAAATCAEVGFDFDCDGTEELGWPFQSSGVCCTNSEQAGWEGAVPKCGETAQFTQCDDQCEPETSAARQRCF